MSRFPIIAAISALLPTFAAAQGFDGAYISIEKLSYPSDDNAGQMTYSGGAEFGFGPGFGVSADLTAYGFDFLDGNATSATVHAFYRVSQTTAIGAFYGYDSASLTLDDPFTGGSFDLDIDGTFYGAEGQASFAGATVEAFLGQSEGDFSQGSIYGLFGQFLFGSFGITADYVALDHEDFGIRDRYSFGGEWHSGVGPTLYAEWGKLGSESLGNESDEEFYTIGVRIGIGSNGGTTFGPRSVIEIAPGG
jgi:hypothetical protein